MMTFKNYNVDLVSQKEIFLETNKNKNKIFIF